MGRKRITNPQIVAERNRKRQAQRVIWNKKQYENIRDRVYTCQMCPSGPIWKNKNSFKCRKQIKAHVKLCSSIVEEIKLFSDVKLDLSINQSTIELTLQQQERFKRFLTLDNLKEYQVWALHNGKQKRDSKKKIQISTACVSLQSNTASNVELPSEQTKSTNADTIDNVCLLTATNIGVYMNYKDKQEVEMELIDTSTSSHYPSEEEIQQPYQKIEFTEWEPWRNIQRKLPTRYRQTWDTKYRRIINAYKYGVHRSAIKKRSASYLVHSEGEDKC